MGLEPLMSDSEDFQAAMDFVLGHCSGGTHYRSTLYPSEEVDLMIRENLRIRNDQETEYRRLLKQHMNYLSSEMVNRRGKWSSKLKNSFWIHSELRKPDVDMNSEERNVFYDKCKRFREAGMRVNPNKSRVYNWHRGATSAPFDNDLIIQMLGEVFKRSGYSYMSVTEKPIDCIINNSDEVTLKREVTHNSRAVLEWPNLILETLNREVSHLLDVNQWVLERLIIKQPPI